MTFARTAETDILRVTPEEVTEMMDMVALEEPLELFITRPDAPIQQDPFAITMRTPGHDIELVAGFMVSEGIVSNKNQIDRIEETMRFHHGQPASRGVTVHLGTGARFDPEQLKRNVIATSSCGVCGRVTMPDIPFSGPKQREGFSVDPGILFSLPERLRAHQTVFKHTGGIHAAALFDRRGLLIQVYEDIGRHNAMDKLVGHALLEDALPCSQHIVLFSGRVSFELMQKAVMAGVQIVVSIGAPSSLAVEMADRFGITLVGFLKPDRFNVYHNTLLAC